MPTSSDNEIPFRFLGGKGTFNAGASVWIYGLCLLIGLPFVYIYLVHAPWQWYRARSFIETPCKIISAEMVPHPTHTHRYDPRVVYEYKWHDQSYQSQRLKILNYSYRRHWEFGEDELRSRYPPGGESLCYVNPQDPAESILDRDLTPVDFIYLPFVLIISGVGAYGLWHRWTHPRCGNQEPRTKDAERSDAPK
jgi:hypothetical protein